MKKRVALLMMVLGVLLSGCTSGLQEKIPSSESVQDGADDSSINSEEYADEIVDDTK